MGVEDQHHAPAALPLRKTQYPLYRRLGGPQGRYGRVRKISPLPGFIPRTVQPVASSYTDYAMSAASLYYLTVKFSIPLNIKQFCLPYNALSELWLENVGL
jgi:hypothetical protein